MPECCSLPINYYWKKDNKNDNKNNPIQYPCHVENRFECPYDYENGKESDAMFNVEDLFELASMAFAVEHKLTAVVGMVAVLTIALAAGTAAHQQVNAACTGDPHDMDSGPTGNPHDDSEHGNPHDSGLGDGHGGGDSCHGAQLVK
jgi:hypothetical protein